MNLFASFVMLSMFLPAPLLTAQCGASSVNLPSAGPTKAPIAWATISIHAHNPADTADPVHSGANFSSGVIKGTGIPMQYLAMMLSMPLERSVVDHTALSGRYDFNLHFQPRNTSTIPDSSEPDLFTAVREQAGL